MLHSIVLATTLLFFIAISLSLTIKIGSDIGLITRDHKAYIRLIRKYLAFIKPNIKSNIKLINSTRAKYVFDVLLLCCAIRITVYLAAWLFQMSAQGDEGQYLSFWLSFDDIWNKWDSPHYLSLADVGYRPPAQNPLHIVFYPLYPWLVSAVHAFFINDLFTAAIFVSLTCYLLAAWVLFKLVEKELGSSATALDSVKYLSIFPFAFFFGTSYTESLFLLTTVTCFWFLRSGKWFWAGLFGGLAALSRNHGILLIIPIAIEAYYQRHTIALKYRIFAILATASGFGAYLLLNWYIFDNPFQFKIAQQENWSQSFGFFSQNVANIFQGMLTDTHSMVFGIWLPTLICFIGACVLLWWGRHRLPVSYQAYSLVYLFISFSPTWLLSGPRYMSALFPLAILTALWAQQSARRKQLLDMSLFTCLILATYLFTRGWVY